MYFLDVFYLLTTVIHNVYCTILLSIKAFLFNWNSHKIYVSLRSDVVMFVAISHKNNVRFVFPFSSSCLWEGSCLIYIICVCSVRLYLQLLVGGLMSYLHYLCLFSSSLPPVVCRRDHVLFTLFVFVQFVFTSSC